jgi:RNA polymerase sigma-70 factor (ECF subfamily)
MLREEVSRLPDHYRLPVQLCYLEGKTNQEAAAQLSCPVGTIKGRLSRARQTLRERLSRRGLDGDLGPLGGTA